MHYIKKVFILKFITYNRLMLMATSYLASMVLNLFTGKCNTMILYTLFVVFSYRVS